MRVRVRFLVVASVGTLLLTGDWLAAQDDVADVVSRDLWAGNDSHKRYFLVEPPKGAKPPKEGYRLLVALPGGDGSADFHPFVKRISKNAVPEGYVLAQPVAVKWTEGKEIVWPTAKDRVEGIKFSTEELIDAVIKDVAGKYNLDPKRVFTLTWSSSGLAGYAASLGNTRVTGSFIAMSVFRPNLLPPLGNAKGHAYFLSHSPDDRVCPFGMAKQAAKELKESGATVKLATYDGGHGWRGNVYGRIREGVEWLDKNAAAPATPKD